MIYLVKKLGLSIANCLIARGYMEIPNFPILGDYTIHGII